jgi:hypothetical protein
MPTCRSCGAEIQWVRTAKGAMPLDAEPTERGNIVVHRADQITVYPSAEIAAAAGVRPEDLRISHFATCPESGAWRRR